jgi:hypothetical protein
MRIEVGNGFGYTNFRTADFPNDVDTYNPSSNAAISFWENLLDRCCGIPIQVSVGNTIPKRTFHPRIANLLATTADNGHWRQLPATVVSGNPSAADNAGLLAALA